MIVAESNQTYDLRGQYLSQGPLAKAVIDIINCHNVTIIGGVLDGLNTGSSDWGTDMYRHLIRVSNSSGITIDSVEFRNPPSDAVCVGIQEDETHPSESVTIKNCVGHGCGQNRQFVSVINAYNVKIINNKSYNMARPDQPGHIDIEPDMPDQSAWNILIEGNYIEGGNARGIQLYNEIARTPTFGYITVRKNVIRGTRDIGIACQGSPSVAEGPVSVTDNDVRGAKTPYYFSNMEVFTGKKRRKKKHR